MSAEATVEVLEAPLPLEEEQEAEPAVEQPRVSPARFVVATTVGLALVAVPFLWVLWDLWDDSWDPLRTIAFGNFYDLQARAMFQGHLYLKNGAIGIEAFVHGGRQYTYFGIFPSLLRMPILAFTHSFDGRLTAPSMLLASVVAAIFSALLIWKVRCLVRGPVLLGWGEAISLGALVASVVGGSVLVYLASAPYVFDEDFAWSVAFTIGSLFALLGLLERPTWGRVVAAFVLILGANLNRAPTGYACVIGAFLVAGWLALGRGGKERRLWAIPVLVAGLVALAVSCLMNYWKFGLPFGLPMASQIWTTVNAHRRAFLAANGGKAFSVGFLPSTLSAYLEPAGISVSRVFPFITLPTAPARPVGGAYLDLTYPTGSITATMPLFFVFGCWGFVAAFLPKVPRGLALMRIPLIAAAAATSGALVWGYIADRYMADFIPLLVLAAAIGLVLLWRHLDGRRRRTRVLALAGVLALTVFGVAVNVAVSVTPQPTIWSSAQMTRYVTLQKRISDVTGHPLNATVVRGNTLPYWAPAGEMFVVGNCDGLYVSTGYDYKYIPDQQFEHLTWIALEERMGGYVLDTTFNSPSVGQPPVPIATIGSTTLTVQEVGNLQGPVIYVQFNSHDPNYPGAGTRIAVKLGVTYPAMIAVDPNLHQLNFFIRGRVVLRSALTTGGPLVLPNQLPGTAPPFVSLSSQPFRPSPMPLCRAMLEGK